jgi:hypothetical protein
MAANSAMISYKEKPFLVNKLRNVNEFMKALASSAGNSLKRRPGTLWKV